MSTLRAFSRDHRILALLLVVLALCMKALVPGGYMIGAHAKTVTVEICGDVSGGHIIKQIGIPSAGKPGESPNEHGKVDSACPYSALSLASLAGPDLLLLALALAIVFALGFLLLAARHGGTGRYLRPPLRGPPALA